MAGSCGQVNLGSSMKAKNMTRLRVSKETAPWMEFVFRPLDLPLARVYIRFIGISSGVCNQCCPVFFISFLHSSRKTARNAREGCN